MVCSNCNANPGTPSRVDFDAQAKSVDLLLCQACFREFQRSAVVDVSRL